MATAADASADAELSQEQIIWRLQNELKQLRLKQKQLEEEDCVRIVLQRCDEAQLLLDGRDEWGAVGRALIVYISFSKGAAETHVQKAAKTVLQIPVVTLGQWGDGVAPCSVMDLLADPGHNEEFSILVVPQASLTAKVKGKSLSYRDQAEKEVAQRLYAHFVTSLSSIAFDLLPGAKPNVKQEVFKKKPSAPLELYFQTGQFEGKYKAYDERGVPTQDADGLPITASQAKKLERLYTQQLEKQKKKEQSGAQPVATPEAIEEQLPTEVAPAEQVTCPGLRVVAGTFGNRQGLRVRADCGPFSHLLTF